LRICIALACASCLSPAEGQFACDPRSPQCPEGWHCRIDRFCYSTPDGIDAGSFDSGVHIDAAVPDAGPPFDGGPFFDAGRTTDAGMVDAAMVDGGMTLIDAGRDAGPPSRCTRDAECDDGNVCTTDTCGGGVPRLCSNTPNTVSCDDGNYCNGENDTCAGGGCVHPGNPCPGECTAGACVPCGEFNQPCCTGGMCNGFRSCDGATCGCEPGSDDCGSSQTCTSGVCEACGELGTDCCRGGVCNVGYCEGRICRPEIP
jgi:hypothetical protein